MKMGANKFLFLDKKKLDEVIIELFEILYDNMCVIAPTGNSFDEDLVLWKSCIISEMQKEERQIVLMYANDVLAGYFRYSICFESASLLMEDIQIKGAFQKTGLFADLYRWLMKQLPKNLLNVEAYANKENLNSQSVLKHLGLVEIGENKNGKSLHYKGQYFTLLEKYS